MGPICCHAILILRTISLEDIPKPTGEVSGVCWSLMGAIVVGAGIVLKWLTADRNELKDELREERAARAQDRKDFESQTNVLMSNILKKKGGSPNDS
jgi:hypothetical protein